MHRSGTSLIAQVLERAGIFMGVVKDHNFEAVHFLSLNQQSLWAAGASWLEPAVPGPENYHLLPAGKLYDEHFKLLSTWQRLTYRLIPRSWGWKDPRNTFTLPMWLTLFPSAKVLHVIRDKEAIAESLKKRNSVPGEVHDERLENLEFNRKLAESYQNQGRSYKEQLGSRYLEINYEDIIALDQSAISSLEKFVKRPLAKEIRHLVQQ